MLIIPAIDLKEGKVVRLVRGEASRQWIYGEDPIEVARSWEEAGSKLIHVVDLDGALSGTPKHTDRILEVARSTSVPIEVGGGIRTPELIRTYLEGGVHRVVLGTQAVREEAFLTEALKTYGERIAIAVDVKEGLVAVEGWVQKGAADPNVFIERLLALGAKTLIYTETSRDGTLQGPPVAALRTILERVAGRGDVIASGGVASMQDLDELCKLKSLGLTGVIIGRALYDGKIDLREAIQRC